MNKIIYVFIDASNLWEIQKSKKRLFDFKKLIKYLEYKFDSSEVVFFYYTAYPANGTRSYNLDAKHKFFTFLKKGLGFNIRKKELKRIRSIIDGVVSVQEKGNMDVEIAVDAMIHIKKYNIAVLFSGDSDFLYLVSYLKSSGKSVYIFSSKNNISEELRTGGDGYIDLLKIKFNIWGDELKHK